MGCSTPLTGKQHTKYPTAAAGYWTRHTIQAEPCSGKTRTRFSPQHLQEDGKMGQSQAGGQLQQLWVVFPSPQF